MKRLSVCFALVVCLSLWAGCAPGGVQVYEDPIEGRTRYFVMYLDGGHYTAVSSREVGGKYHLEVMYIRRGQINRAVAPGTEVVFKVGAQTQTLTTVAPAEPVTNTNDITVFTQWQLKLEPTREQMRALSQGPMTAIRADIVGETLTLVPNEGQAAQIQTNLADLAGLSNASM